MILNKNKISLSCPRNRGSVFQSAMQSVKWISKCAGVTIFLFTIPLTTTAAELTAIQLQEYCNETDKGLLGQPFDAQKSEDCRGYMMGFFDSMIITTQYAGKPLFCVPSALPKTNNNKILNTWIEKNDKIAPTTTAAVALFSAYTKAFPCK